MLGLSFSGSGRRRACTSATHRRSEGRCFLKIAPSGQLHYGTVLRTATCLLVVFISAACSSVEPSREGNAGNSTTVDTTTIVTSDMTRPLGPAWIDQQRWINPAIDTEDTNGFELYRDYVLINPNDMSTPMGALCWAHHEVERAIARDITRDILDSDTIPIYVEALGLTTEQVGTGARATDVLRELFRDQDDNANGPVDISVDDLNISDEGFEVLKYGWDNSVVPLDEIGGEGTEWLGMFQEVAKPEVVAATRAGGGLPVPVQKYADALFDAVNEYLDGTRTDLSDPRGLSYTLSNWEQFVEVAKYSQDCQRAWLVVDGKEFSGGNSTVSAFAVAESSTTTLITTTTSLNTRSLSKAWLESISISDYDGSLEHDRLQEDYWLSNPNSLSTPMGAFCWAYHEIGRAMWRLLTYATLVPHMEWVMDKLDITVAQVGEAGPSRNTAVLDILAEGRIDQIGSIDSTNLSDDELALIWFHSDQFIEHYRIENRIAGDGTEWYDAIRAVAKPEVIAATGAGDGLPATVVPYADRFFQSVNRLAVDNRPARDRDYNADAYSTLKLPDPLPADIIAFYEEAKYSPDCKRAYFSSSFVVNSSE